ncbi:MAG: hypothetical protein Q4F79_01050 [Eubacteriales bacterium]|nr:hypothetical protein [Eubacteriales bacterium]
MVLFVDINDTCRAAAAALYYQAAKGVPASHAGMFAEEGICPGKLAGEAAHEQGIDLGDVTSVGLCEELLRRADCVCAVTASIAARLAEDYPAYAHKIRSIEIPDPFGLGKQAYLDCFARICEQVEGLE